MPITSFKCTECGKEFAKIYMRWEDRPNACPVCGAASLEEVGPAFKGEREAMVRLGGCASCTDDQCSTSAESG